MAVNFFIDADNGSLAFQKEQDYPDWDNSVYDANAGTTWTADPGTINEVGRALDVRNVRKAIIIISPVGTPGTYDFTVKAGSNSSNISGWYAFDGGDYAGIAGNLYIGVDCLGVDYLTVVVDALSVYTELEIEMAPIPFETSI